MALSAELDAKRVYGLAAVLSWPHGDLEGGKKPSEVAYLSSLIPDLSVLEPTHLFPLCFKLVGPTFCQFHQS